MIGKTMD